MVARVGGDGLLPGKEDKWGVFQTYNGHLVLFLFASEDTGAIEAKGGDEGALNAARREGVVFLDWVMADRAHVSLHPFKKLCLQNIIDNDMMVLRRGKLLLVRHPVDRELLCVPDCLTVEERTIEGPSGSYRNTVYSYRPDGFADLSDMLHQESKLMGRIRIVVDMYSALSGFREDSAPKGCAGIPNVFADGLMVDCGSWRPLVPDSIFCPRLLVSEDGSSVRAYDNTADIAWQLLLDRIRSSGLCLLPYAHVSQVQAGNLEEYLPSDAVDSESQVAFLRLFVATIGPVDSLTPHAVDRRRLLTAVRFAQWLLDEGRRTSTEREPTLVGLALRNYLSLTGTRGFARRLVFAPVDRHSDKDLLSLWQSIEFSLRACLEKGDEDWGDRNPIDLLRHGFAAVASVVRTVRDRHEPLDEEVIRDALNRQEDWVPADMAILGEVRLEKVETGLDYEILVNDLRVLPAHGTADDGRPVFVCRFGGYAPNVETLRSTHASDLSRSLVYVYGAIGGILLVLPDDPIRASYETVSRRSVWWSRRVLPDTDQSIVEGLQDRLDEISHLRGHPSFNAAILVLLANHQTSDLISGDEVCKRFLLRWLGQFSNTDAETILQVIAAHQPISRDDVNTFINNVFEQKHNGMVFATKRTADMGGVQRLFTLTARGQDIFRCLALDDAIGRIATPSNEGSPSTLVLITENILSGSQLRRALERHYLAETSAGVAIVKGSQLHTIPCEQRLFLTMMRRFERVIVVAAAYTDEGWATVHNVLCTRMELAPDNVTVLGRALNGQACFLDTTPNIPFDVKTNFKRIASDIERLSIMFNLDGDNKTIYESSLTRIDKANLVVRPNSVPKMVARIFTLQPRNRHLDPLFRLIPEHGT